jgi:hypothetical protein
MAHVAFESESRGEGRVRAAVEIRGEDLALAGTCLAGGRGVELPPGSYHAFASYPDGHTAHRAFTVADGAEQARVSLEAPAPPAAAPAAAAPPPAPPSPPGRAPRRRVAERLGRLRFRLRLPADLGGGFPLPSRAERPPARTPPSQGKSPSPVRTTVPAEIWAGDPLLGLSRPARARPRHSGILAPRTRPFVAQVELDRRPVNVVVPAGVALRLPAPGEAGLPQPEFADPDLAAAVGFYARGLTREVATVAHVAPRYTDGGGDAEAAAWAYLLLATGSTEQADRIVMHVDRPATPDEAVLHAGLLGRLGDHAMALSSLSRMAESGVPAFAAGVLLAVERLRLYSAADDLDDRGEAADILTLIQPFATALVPGAVLTTYGGADPAKPEPVVSD